MALIFYKVKGHGQMVGLTLNATSSMCNEYPVEEP